MDIAEAMTSAGESIVKENPPKQEESIPATPVAETPATEGKVETPSTETPSTPAAETPKPQEQKELSDDELLSLLQKRGIKLPEEKKKTEDEEEAEFIAYGTAAGKLKVDDYVDAKKLKDVKDSDLVYQEFAAKLKGKDKHITEDKIQAKFDKKFGDEIMDETDNPKIVYDDDLISEEATKIREQRFAPINTLKNEFGQHSKAQQFEKQVQTEFKRDIEKNVSDKVVVKHGNVDYTIELDKPFQDFAKQRLFEGFKDFKSDPSKYGNNFDAGKYVEFIVKTNKFDDIVEIASKQRSDVAVLEALKPFKNPVESEKTRDTTPAGGKTATQGADDMANILGQFKG